jgi:deoxyribodipyrimidine photo-lyase
MDTPGVPTLAELGIESAINVPVADPDIACQRLEAFVGGPIYDYGHSRNALISDPFAADPAVGTSYLSPYLRFGLLSPRAVYWAAQDALAAAPGDEARQSVNAWINELIWREFYAHILYHFPHVNRGNFRREYDALRWRDAPQEFAAWQRGETGYPIVDAAMRQLRQIGWMPNRARMIVASFLTKDLLIHWQAGEQHFMQCLIDGDPAANNGGWQWAAGTGTDAQPYFRIFNPVSQGQKYDPQGVYVRRWLPELRDTPDKFIHAPWMMNTPPAGYPAPVVDHALARQRTLAAFKAIKG